MKGLIVRSVGITRASSIIQMIYKGNPEGMVEYMNNPKNLREDYPEMPPQNYLSDKAKIAVAEYILTLKK